MAGLPQVENVLGRARLGGKVVDVPKRDDNDEHWEKNGP